MEVEYEHLPAVDRYQGGRRKRLYNEIWFCWWSLRDSIHNPWRLYIHLYLSIDFGLFCKNKILELLTIQLNTRVVLRSQLCVLMWSWIQLLSNFMTNSWTCKPHLGIHLPITNVIDSITTTTINPKGLLI